jgi:hypothetical protein
MEAIKRLKKVHDETSRAVGRFCDNPTPDTRNEAQQANATMRAAIEIELERAAGGPTGADVYKIQDALGNLISAVRKTTRRQIDAGACGTKWDRQQARVAEEAEEEALDAFWLGLLGTARPKES